MGVKRENSREKKDHRIFIRVVGIEIRYFCTSHNMSAHR